MKTLIIATAMAASLSTSAFAGGLTFGGSAEYQVEAEKFETTVGAAYGMGDITVAPAVTLYYTSADELTFDSVEVTVSYTLTENLAVYGTVEADSDFDYQEATVGVAFNF